MEKYIYTQHIPTKNPLNTSLHHAIILRGNKVLASAFNKVGSRSRGCGYWEKTIHAEVNVVKSLGDLNLLRGATLIVVRHGPDGTLKSSKPCENCRNFLQKCMDEYGLRKVIYS
jgi:hypothetical protein